MTEAERKAMSAVLAALKQRKFEKLNGNFISIDPEGHLAPIPWGSENLQNLLDKIEEHAVNAYEDVKYWEQIECLQMYRSLYEDLKKKYDAIEKAFYKMQEHFI